MSLLRNKSIKTCFSRSLLNFLNSVFEILVEFLNQIPKSISYHICIQADLLKKLFSQNEIVSRFKGCFLLLIRYSDQNFKKQLLMEFLPLFVRYRFIGISFLLELSLSPGDIVECKQNCPANLHWIFDVVSLLSPPSRNISSELDQILSTALTVCTGSNMPYLFAEAIVSLTFLLKSSKMLAQIAAIKNILANLFELNEMQSNTLWLVWKLYLTALYEPTNVNQLLKTKSLQYSVVVNITELRI